MAVRLILIAGALLAAGCFKAVDVNGTDNGTRREGGVGHEHTYGDDGRRVDGGSDGTVKNDDGRSPDSSVLDAGSDETESGRSRERPGPCVEDLDRGNTGTVNLRRIHTYDDDGRLLSTERDDDVDGTVDTLITYTYDDEGRLSFAEFHDDVDGTADALASYTYDDEGRLSFREYDDFVDGTVDTLITYAYDDEGRLSSEESCSGMSTSCFFVHYTYDEGGSLLTKEYGFSVSGSPFRTDRYTYDENGNVIRVESNNVWYPTRYRPVYENRLDIYVYTYDCWERNGDRWVYTNPVDPSRL
jgi:hypothetical protein